MSSVTLRKVMKRYGQVQVVHGIDLDVEEGEFVVLLGPSGCGKTTTLRMVAGLEGISDGEMRIAGRVVNDVAPKDREIAMVFQNYALYPHMTVRRNMEFALKPQRLPASTVAERIAEASRILGLEPLLERKPSQLSGGQRQRVAMGRAMVRTPKVFLFDEPLSNLDAKLRTQVRLEIAKLHKRLGTTVLYVTHDQIEAMTLADRIAVMYGGEIQQFDTPQAIYSRPVNRFVADFIGSPGMNFFEGTVEANGGRPRFVAEGFEVPLDTYGFEKGEVAGGPAELGVRPEHVGLNSGEGWPFSYEAAVEVVEPMGSETLVWSKFGKQDMTVRLPSERAPDVGDKVTLGFDPMRASLFDGASGRRL